jgi:hypothetical protein
MSCERASKRQKSSNTWKWSSEQAKSQEQANSSEQTTNHPFDDEPCMFMRAMISMANGQCLELGRYLQWDPVSIKVQVVGQNKDPCAMTTWLPKNRLMCKMALLKSKRTVLDIDGRFFFASEEFSLHKDCPENVVFFAQYTEDVVKTEKPSGKDTVNHMEPRLLVYDICVLEQTIFGMQVKKLPPEERYKLLRETYGRFLPKNKTILQWVGHQKHAQKLLSGDVKIGHEVETLALLGEESGDLIKVLCVHIPEHVVRFKKV